MGLEHPDLHIDVFCKQTAYKFERDYDIVIVDEIHNCLSSVHGKCLTIPTKNLLGLTASPPSHREELMEELELRCPVIFTRSLAQCIKDKISPPYKMYNLPVNLTRSEWGIYSKWDKMFTTATTDLRMYINSLKLDINAFDLASEAIKNKLHPMNKPAQLFYTAMSKRKEVVYGAESKKKKCIELIFNNPSKKWIIFAKRIKFVDELCEALNAIGITAVKYHSDMKAAEKNATLEAIKLKETKVLVSAEALIVGYDLPELDCAISAAGVATELVGIQSLGRVNRIVEGKMPVFVNLYCDKTQELSWVTSRTKELNVNWVKTSNEIIWF